MSECYSVQTFGDPSMVAYLVASPLLRTSVLHYWDNKDKFPDVALIITGNFRLKLRKGLLEFLVILCCGNVVW